METKRIKSTQTSVIIRDNSYRACSVSCPNISHDDESDAASATCHIGGKTVLLGLIAIAGQKIYHPARTIQCIIEFGFPNDGRPR